MRCLSHLMSVWLFLLLSVLCGCFVYWYTYDVLMYCYILRSYELFGDFCCYPYIASHKFSLREHCGHIYLFYFRYIKNIVVGTVQTSSEDL